MSNIVIYKEVRVPKNYTGPGIPTGRYIYFDGAIDHAFDTKHEAAEAAYADGERGQIKIRRLFV